MQQLEAHVLTSCATEGLAKNMQREDQLIFALLHTFWEVRPHHHTLAPPLSHCLISATLSVPLRRPSTRVRLYLAVWTCHELESTI